MTVVFWILVLSLKEIHKMFSETGSFYYCKDGDLTKSTQGQHSNQPSNDANNSGAFWETADDRFFWNKFMMQELIDSKVLVKLYSIDKQSIGQTGSSKDQVIGQIGTHIKARYWSNWNS